MKLKGLIISTLIGSFALATPLMAKDDNNIDNLILSITREITKQILNQFDDDNTNVIIQHGVPTYQIPSSNNSIFSDTVWFEKNKAIEDMGLVKSFLHGKSFAGMLPAADCAGINTVITFDESGRYRKVDRYENDNQDTFNEQGKWSVSDEGEITLTNTYGEKTRFILTRNRQLMMQSELYMNEPVILKQVETERAEQFMNRQFLMKIDERKSYKNDDTLLTLSGEGGVFIAKDINSEAYGGSWTQINPNLYMLKIRNKKLYLKPSGNNLIFCNENGYTGNAQPLIQVDNRRYDLFKFPQPLIGTFRYSSASPTKAQFVTQENITYDVDIKSSNLINIDKDRYAQEVIARFIRPASKNRNAVISISE